MYPMFRTQPSGDEVVLLGQQGEEEISAAELAERASTIHWDIVSALAAGAACVLCEARWFQIIFNE